MQSPTVATTHTSSRITLRVIRAVIFLLEQTDKLFLALKPHTLSLKSFYFCIISALHLLLIQNNLISMYVIFMDYEVCV